MQARPSGEAGRADVGVEGLVKPGADAKGATAGHGQRRRNWASHSTPDVTNSLSFTIS